jgi:predicted transcriptional regulator of viral defense system
LNVSADKANEAAEIFREHGGLLRTTEARELGIHPRVLYYLRDTGRLRRLSRGVYRLADLPPMDHPDLAVVAARAPEARISLLSALAFHELTTEIPHEVYVTLPRGQRAPSLDHPPLRVFHVSGDALTTGVEHYNMEGVDVSIYNPAKTVADCFKFRGQIGTSIAVQALRSYLEKRTSSVADVLRYGRFCRVDRVMQPYLEALTA